MLSYTKNITGLLVKCLPVVISLIVLMLINKIFLYLLVQKREQCLIASKSCKLGKENFKSVKPDRKFLGKLFSQMFLCQLFKEIANDWKTKRNTRRNSFKLNVNTNDIDPSPLSFSQFEKIQPVALAERPRSRKSSAMLKSVKFVEQKDQKIVYNQEEAPVQIKMLVQAN